MRRPLAGVPDILEAGACPSGPSFDRDTMTGQGQNEYSSTELGSIKNIALGCTISSTEQRREEKAGAGESIGLLISARSLRSGAGIVSDTQGLEGKWKECRTRIHIYNVGDSIN